VIVLDLGDGQILVDRLGEELKSPPIPLVGVRSTMLGTPLKVSLKNT
jgi:hypothetical protein